MLKAWWLAQWQTCLHSELLPFGVFTAAAVVVKTTKHTQTDTPDGYVHVALPCRYQPTAGVEFYKQELHLAAGVQATLQVGFVGSSSTSTVGCN